MGKRLALALFALGCGARSELDVPDASSASDASVQSDAATDANDSGMTTFAKCEAKGVQLLGSIPGDFKTGHPEFPDQIALDERYVYFHTWHGGVHRVPKNGGPVETIVSLGPLEWPYPSAFVLDQTSITVLGMDGASTSRLVRTPKAGGIPSLSAAIPGRPLGLAAASGGFYVWNSEGVTGATTFFLTVVSPNGASLSATIPEPGAGVSHVIDQGSSPAWVTSSGGLFLLDVPGGMKVTPVLPLTIYGAVDDGDALYVTGGDVNVAPPSQVLRIDKSTHGKTLLADVGDTAMGIAVDEANVYFCDRFEVTVDKIPKSGGALTTVAKGDGDQAIDVAVDDTCVYWTVLAGKGDEPTTAKVFAAPK